VEWSLLLFFAALFVVMQGLERSGIVDRINHDGLAWMTPGGRWSTATAVSGVMLVLSNLISNVPAVILWRSAVPMLPDPRFVWSVLAMSATLAGNMLLIGSMANLIVAERAEARGVTLGYWEFARAGIPVTLLTIGWGIVILVLTA
jgi:Na+/H+ antiporter NhaD/arsenite permease-like protein